MDLWIRSQDKEMLCKAECIELMHDDPEYAKIYLNGQFPELIVGSFKKKQAIKVLNQIQNLLIDQDKLIINANLEDYESFEMVANNIKTKGWCGITDEKKDSEIKYISPNTIVYQMPEE